MALDIKQGYIPTMSTSRKQEILVSVPKNAWGKTRLHYRINLYTNQTKNTMPPKLRKIFLQIL